MEINSSLWSASNYYSSSQGVTSTQTGDSGFMDIFSAVQNSNSYIDEMNSYGVQDLGNPPDFASMSTEEFLAHLIEVQESLATSGVDISEMTDPTTFTTEELEEMKAEMQKPPPPPPSMEMMNFNFVDYSSLATSALETLFDYL